MTGITRHRIVKAWKELSVIAVLILLLTWIWAKGQSPDQSTRARMQEALQALQIRDAELNRDALMVRAGLLPHYDSLADFGLGVLRALEVLRRENGRLVDGTREAIDRELRILTIAVQQKLTAVEYLKSDNALLRNSLSFFTQSVQPDGRRDREELSEVAALSQVMLRFMESPDAGARTDAEAALARVSDASSRQPPMALLDQHGRLIVKVLPQVDATLSEIVGAPTARHAEALQDALLESSASAERRARRFRLLLYLVAVVLSGYLIVQFFRLRANARELRRQEIQLIQANKMTALGTLASSVAHEINNPNQVIVMNSAALDAAWQDALDILDAQAASESSLSLGGLPYAEMRTTVPRLLREVDDGARRIERIVGDLKHFVRPAGGTMQDFQLNDSVRRALRLLAHRISLFSDHLHVALGDPLPLMRGDEQQVEQVVVNLVLNALEALPDRRAAVTVATSFDGARQCVVLEVQDEGTGIASEHLSSLGEPFFTTKQAQGGTGLGLAIVSSLVRSHGGRLGFVSRSGKGTRATVDFPCRPESSPTLPMLGAALQ